MAVETQWWPISGYFPILPHLLDSSLEACLLSTKTFKYSYLYWSNIPMCPLLLFPDSSELTVALLSPALVGYSRYIYLL